LNHEEKLPNIEVRRQEAGYSFWISDFGLGIEKKTKHRRQETKSKIQNVSGVFENEDRNEGVFGSVCGREKA